MFKTASVCARVCVCVNRSLHHVTSTTAEIRGEQIHYQQFYIRAGEEQK